MTLVISIFCLGGVSFAIAFFTTLAMKHLAPKLGFVDKPGGRKIHANPKPLGGGVAILLGFVVPVLAGLAIIHLLPPPAASASSLLPAYWSGVREKRTDVALELIGAAVLMHLLGLWDDRKALGPYLKLCV